MRLNNGQVIQLLMAFGLVGEFFSSGGIAQDVSQEPRLDYRVVQLKNVRQRPGEYAFKVTLKNIGLKPVTVYWGSDGHPEMYRFEIWHQATGRRIPVLESPYENPTQLRRAAEKKFFRRIDPGEEITHVVSFSAGFSGQHLILRQAGGYLLRPSLHAETDQVLGEEGLLLASDAWTGDLEAEPLTINVPVRSDDEVGLKPLGGSVVDADGAPVADAIIQLRYSNEPGNEFNWQNAVLWENVFTDKDGGFEFDGVPQESDYSLTVHHPEFARGYLVYDQDSFEAGEPLKVRLPKTVNVSGRVVDSGGEPLGGVRVNSVCFTDADGEFSFKTALQSDTPLRMNLWRRGFVGLNKQLSWKDATARDLEFVLRSEESLSATGQARFIDGSPAANVKLYFNLKNAKEIQNSESYTSQVRAESDSEGRFKVILPDDNSYDAEVIAEEKSDIGAGRRWTCAIQKLQAGKDNMNLEFDNRGRIVLRLFQGTKLTKSQKITIAIRSETYQRSVAWNRFDGDLTGHVYSGLEPGKYHLNARVEDFGYEEWKATVEVPDETPNRALAIIKIPKIEFGSIAGTLLMPDGKTPARDVAVRASAGRGKMTTTDENGHFAIKDLPVGDVWCSVQPAEGLLLLKPLSGRIEAGKVTDFGTLRLSREKDEFGWVEGKLTYTDGMAVKGYSLLGVVERYVFTSSGWPFSGTGDSNGVFKVRAKKGAGLAVFDIFGTGHPRNFISGSLVPRRKLFKSVATKVDVVAGKTLQRNIVVPKRSDCRNLIIKWTLKQSPRLTAIVIQEDLQWIFESQETGVTRLSQHGKPNPADNSFEFKGLPKGKGHIIIDAAGAGQFEIVELNDEGMTEYVIEQKELASIDVYARDEDGKPFKDFAIRASTLFMGSRVYAGGMSIPSEVPPGWGKTASQGIYSRPAVGHVRASGLGARKYTIAVRVARPSGPIRYTPDFNPDPRTIPRTDWLIPFEVELKPNAKRRIDVTVDSTGKLLRGSVE